MSAMKRVLVCACVTLLGMAPRAVNAQAQPPAAEQGAAKRGEEAFKRAIDRLKSPDATVRADAADEIGRRGYRMRKEISEVLRPIMLTDPESTVRAAAGRALGRLGVREAEPDLVRAALRPCLRHACRTCEDRRKLILLHVQTLPVSRGGPFERPIFLAARARRECGVIKGASR